MSTMKYTPVKNKPAHLFTGSLRIKTIINQEDAYGLNREEVAAFINQFFHSNFNMTVNTSIETDSKNNENLVANTYLRISDIDVKSSDDASQTLKNTVYNWFQELKQKIPSADPETYSIVVL